MNSLYYLITLIVAIIVFFIVFFINKWANKSKNIYFKVISLILLVALFNRYCLGFDNLENIKYLKVGFGFSNKFEVILAFFQVTFTYALEIMLILYPFFKTRLVHSVVTLFGSVVCLINVIFMKNHVNAIVGGDLNAITIRALLMSVELGITIAYVVGIFFTESDKVLVKNKQWIWFAVAILGMFICNSPLYSLQYFLNSNKWAMCAIDLNFWHRLYLYPAFLMPIALYFILKNFSIETRRSVLIYYTCSMLFFYINRHKYSTLSSVTSWPLHLCNTAMFITPLCLLFNLKKLFYFTYFINVLGAFFAITMPNYSDGFIFASDTVGFFRDHYQAFAMPLLLVGLGIFQKPKWKEFKYSLIGFACYFFLIVFINAWFTNYNPDVDYFFVNSGFIAEKLGTWAERLRDFQVAFNIGKLNFVLYPVYQVLFYLVYFALSFGMWFLYEACYDIIDGWRDIAFRKKAIKMDRIALECELNGRSIEEPLNMEGVNQLVLKNFTKRYGKSDVYAVKDANLQVNSGEIFGFLGPNGAGKSTIIKSIVGIQTITQGNIEVCGYDVAKQSLMAKRQIGFVPDHYALYENLTAREYINYIADLYNVSKQDREQRLNNYVKLFEFESAIDNKIKTYSHGMKQKVTIMSALIHNPKVWILDEPLTGLDPNSIYQVKECMRKHAEEGNIVFFSSHIIDVVERICDRIAIIRKGQIQCVKTVEEIEKDGVSLEDYYMSVINDKDIKPIFVNESLKA